MDINHVLVTNEPWSGVEWCGNKKEMMETFQAIPERYETANTERGTLTQSVPNDPNDIILD